MDKDVKHNHMYDVQRCKPSDYPSTAKAKNKCVEITPTFIDVIQLCMFSERERASVVCWVVDVLGLCKLVCYVRTPPERRIQTLFLKRKILV